MKKIKEKLNSNDGVSILIALVGFMVAAMISVVIVSAAVTATERVANDETTNQAHLTLESAAQIVRDTMEGTTESVSGGLKESTAETAYQFSAYTPEGKFDTDTAQVSGEFGQEIKTAVEFVNTYNTGYDSLINTSPDTNFEVSLNGGAIKEKVKVSFTMDENYNIIFTFKIDDDDGSEECLYLDMPASAISKDPASGFYVINWKSGSGIIYN